MIIGFTGTRHGMTSEQWQRVFKLISYYAPTELHHGDCFGADAEAHDIAITCQVDKIIIHPPYIHTLRAHCATRLGDEILPARQYDERNRDIVQASDLIIAAPPTEQEVSVGGTWQTVRFSREYNKPCKVVLPSGIVVDA